MASIMYVSRIWAIPLYNLYTTLHRNTSRPFTFLSAMMGCLSVGNVAESRVPTTFPVMLLNQRRQKPAAANFYPLPLLRLTDSCLDARLTMGSESRGRSTDPRRQNARRGVDSIVTEGPSASSSGLSKLELVQKAFMSPFSHKKADSTRILSDRMCLT